MTIATTPKPPYVAVIFTSLRDDSTLDGGTEAEAYAQTAAHMVALAEKQVGFLGMESSFGPENMGITVSYWRDEECVKAWKQQADHQTAQQAGKNRWYRAYKTRVATVSREYGK